MAWQEGRSFKHEQDIRDILVAVRLGDDPELTAMFDTAYVDDWAERLGQEVEELWQRLKVLANLSLGSMCSPEVSAMWIADVRASGMP